jgi:CRISPR-associated protein Cas5h
LAEWKNTLPSITTYIEMKLVSFDLRADMGFLKKPDINEKIYLTYNMLHRPALLGILGAIAGLKGYKRNGEMPDYYQKLKHLKIGIEPLDSDKGNYTKTTISYNNTIGFASSEDGGNLIVTEQVLLKPSFRCYILLDTSNEVEQTLYNRISNQEAEYLPYLGKNDFSAWWEKDSVKEYYYKQEQPQSSFLIKSIFNKEGSIVKEEKQELMDDFNLFSMEPTNTFFFYFEKLPIGFDEDLKQYQMADFAYTSAKFKKNASIKNLYFLQEEEKYVQLF